MTERETHIREWIEEISIVRSELGGFSVCPYASKANYTIIECFAADIVPVPGYDVVFYVVEDEMDLEGIQYWVNFYNDIHNEYVFLEDCANYDSFIEGVQTNNGAYNLILMQNRKELRKHRAFLESLGYYAHWSDEMMREVLGEDYEMVKNRDSNPVKSSV
jgi:hypothetical protein